MPPSRSSEIDRGGNRAHDASTSARGTDARITFAPSRLRQLLVGPFARRRFGRRHTFVQPVGDDRAISRSSPASGNGRCRECRSRQAARSRPARRPLRKAALQCAVGARRTLPRHQERRNIFEVDQLVRWLPLVPAARSREHPACPAGGARSPRAFHRRIVGERARVSRRLVQRTVLEPVRRADQLHIVERRGAGLDHQEALYQLRPRVRRQIHRRGGSRMRHHDRRPIR